MPLIWLYRPDAPGVNRQLGAEAPPDGGHWLTTVHRLSSTALFWLTLVLLVAVVFTPTIRRRWSWAVAVVALGVAGGVTGYLLPWNQVALRAVTVGTNIRGVLEPLGGDARFLLIDGAEISKGTYLVAVLVHVVVLPLVALAGGLAFRRSIRRHPT